MDFSSAADELYGVRPADFVATRKRLAQDAKAAGDGPLAKRIGGLRRPTLSAWAVNLLARSATGDVERLLDVGAEMRAAWGSGGGLGDLEQRRARLVGSLVRAAGELAAEAGNPLREQAVREVEDTLQAATVDPGIADEVRTGRLSQPRSHTGFVPAGFPLAPEADAGERAELPPDAEPEKAEKKAEQEKARPEKAQLKTAQPEKAEKAGKAETKEAEPERAGREGAGPERAGRAGRAGPARAGREGAGPEQAGRERAGREGTESAGAGSERDGRGRGSVTRTSAVRVRRAETLRRRAEEAERKLAEREERADVARREAEEASARVGRLRHELDQAVAERDAANRRVERAEQNRARAEEAAREAREAAREARRAADRDARHG